MEDRVLRVIFVSIIFIFFFCSKTDQCCAADKSPSIFVSNDTYEFAPVPAGQIIIHDFIIHNKGSAPLLIDSVEFDCGCTTVAFTKEIPSGGKGKITVQLNTIDYGGNFIQKYVEIFSNDPQTPVLSLTIKGTVDKFVDIDPLTAYLKGRSGTDIKTQVTITPAIKYPFRILEMKTQKEKDIRCSLTQKNLSNGSTAYILTIENVKESPGRYFDVVHLKTDSQIQPVLKVFVSGDIDAQ